MVDLIIWSRHDNNNKSRTISSTSISCVCLSTDKKRSFFFYLTHLSLLFIDNNNKQWMRIIQRHIVNLAIESQIIRPTTIPFINEWVFVSVCWINVGLSIWYWFICIYELGLLYQSNAFTFGETEDYIAFQ